MNKWHCNQCGVVFENEEMLVAANPFIQGESLCGCPCCKAIFDMRDACSVTGCSMPVAKDGRCPRH